VHKSLPLFPVSQLNPVHTLQPNVSNIPDNTGGEYELEAPPYEVFSIPSSESEIRLFREKRLRRIKRRNKMRKGRRKKGGKMKKVSEK
jgi:hypothetical protein